MNPVHTHPPYIFRSILILSFYICTGLQKESLPPHICKLSPFMTILFSTLPTDTCYRYYITESFYTFRGFPCYISAGGNAGTQSLSRFLKVATPRLDCHSLASNKLVGLLIAFKALHKQDQTENYLHVIKRNNCRAP
jgi:hypothetical protein